MCSVRHIVKQLLRRCPLNFVSLYHAQGFAETSRWRGLHVAGGAVQKCVNTYINFTIHVEHYIRCCFDSAAQSLLDSTLAALCDQLKTVLQCYNTGFKSSQTKNYFWNVKLVLQCAYTFQDITVPRLSTTPNYFRKAKTLTSLCGNTGLNY